MSIAEEIEEVGKSEVRAVESAIELLLLHLLKIASAPPARPVRHWRGEVVTQHRSLIKALRPSMRALISLDEIWDAECLRADAALEDGADSLLLGWPRACPFSLDAHAEPLDLEAAIARIRAAAAADGPVPPRP